ncbi:MAG TPA: DUF3467 domain-containing protein [Solirubrobacterales bacterium]|nr:DUF3467 domain-containing protein [Solirubrobacterales bacterium]
MDENLEEDGQSAPEIVIRPEEMAGSWANYAVVSHSEHEFTLDFVRLETDHRRGIVVSRVSVSPLFVTQLIDALQANWKSYAEKALPREIKDEPSDND